MKLWISGMTRGTIFLMTHQFVWHSIESVPTILWNYLLFHLIPKMRRTLDLSQSQRFLFSFSLVKDPTINVFICILSFNDFKLHTIVEQLSSIGLLFSLLIMHSSISLDFSSASLRCLCWSALGFICCLLNMWYIHIFIYINRLHLHPLTNRSIQLLQPFITNEMKGFEAITKKKDGCKKNGWIL